MVKVHCFTKQDIIDFKNVNQNLMDCIQDLVDANKNMHSYLYFLRDENKEKYKLAIDKIIFVLHNIKLKYTTYSIKDKMLKCLLMEVLHNKKDSKSATGYSRSVKTITVRNKVALVLAKADTYIIYHKLSGSLIDILNSQDVIDDAGLTDKDCQYIIDDDFFIHVVIKYQKELNLDGIFNSDATCILDKFAEIAQR